MKRALFEDEHESFRDTVRRFAKRHVVADYDRWDDEGAVPRELWKEAGKAGLLGFGLDTPDFRFNTVLLEEMLVAAPAVGVGFSLHNDVALPYLRDHSAGPERGRWCRDVASGDAVLAIAMSEPVAGSDLRGMRTSARREGDHYVLNGSKTFITNGHHADLIIVAAKVENSSRDTGMTLLVVERGMAGFTRGARLRKVGLHAQDTAELFFDDVRVPVQHRLGEEGEGLTLLMANLPQERLSIALGSVAVAWHHLERTIKYVKAREAFERTVFDFQNTRFRLAEMRTELTIARTFADECVRELNAGLLTPERAAMAKWWCTELQKRVIDACVQLHGGNGFMLEYEIARAYRDWRAQTIYGGSTEVMKHLIAKAL